MKTFRLNRLQFKVTPFARPLISCAIATLLVAALWLLMGSQIGASIVMAVGLSWIVNGFVDEGLKQFWK